VNFLADENLEMQVIERLRQDGYNVLAVIEMEPGISDELVLERANQISALLLTNDKDFGELVFRLKRLTAGVVLLRLAGLSNSEKSALVVQSIRQHGDKLVNAFTVISPRNLRIRRFLKD
jgi:predicted nuclease of predicted toxin-antitoxin system